MRVDLDLQPEIGVVMTWYPQSTDDRDAHRGTLSRSRVDVVCGVRFRPHRWAFGQAGIPSPPPDPAQICATCDLIAAHHAEPLDLLVELVGLFARLEQGDR